MSLLLLNQSVIPNKELPLYLNTTQFHNRLGRFLHIPLLIFFISFNISTQVIGKPQAKPDPRRPNILLIVSDDQGYNDLGLLGNGILTPHLDKLAKQGTRLTNFYVAWPACTPSRASLLTGRYPQRNGIYDMIRNEAPDYGYQYTAEELSLIHI